MNNKIISGVYQIINTSTKRMYIGISNNIHKRYATHLTNLRHSKHTSIKFQYAWDFCDNKSDFELNILEIFEDNMLDSEKRSIKTKYIRHFASDLFGYNMNDNSTEFIYNRKYDRELYEKHKKMNFEIYWWKHCIDDSTGHSQFDRLPNKLIRKSSKLLGETNISGCEYRDKYFTDLIDNLRWIETRNEYDVMGTAKTFVPPLSDHLYRIHKTKDLKDNTAYMLKFKYWFDKDLFWKLFNRFKARGGKYEKRSNEISFTYDPSELPLIDIITKALYPEEEKRQSFLKHYAEKENEYLACS